MQKTEAHMTPQQHAQNITQLLQQAQQKCRANIEQVDDPKAQALFETVAEVLGGAMTALEHYQLGSEQAWQPSNSSGEGEKRRAVQNMPDGQRIPPQGPQPPVVTDMAPDIDERFPPPKMHTE